MILTFYGRDEDTELRTIFFECIFLGYVDPQIVWKEEDTRKVVISRDGDERELTGNITIDLIKATIREMCSGIVGEESRSRS